MSILITQWVALYAAPAAENASVPAVVIVDVAHDDLAAPGIDRHVDRTRKRQSLLDQVIRHQPQFAALRKDRPLFVDRAVLEAEDEMHRDLAAAQELRLFAAGEKRPVKRAQREKTVIGPFGVACDDGFRERPGSVEQRAHHEDGEYPAGAHQATSVAMAVPRAPQAGLALVRKGDHEPRTTVRLVLGPRLPAVKLDEVLHDGEAEACPARPRSRLVDAIKAFEDA
jgi:hypothetical protein